MLHGAAQRANARRNCYRGLTALRAGTPAARQRCASNRARRRSCDWTEEFDRSVLELARRSRERRAVTTRFLLPAARRPTIGCIAPSKSAERRSSMSSTTAPSRTVHRVRRRRAAARSDRAALLSTTARALRCLLDAPQYAGRSRARCAGRRRHAVADRGGRRARRGKCRQLERCTARRACRALALTRQRWACGRERRCTRSTEFVRNSWCHVMKLARWASRVLASADGRRQCARALLAELRRGAYHASTIADLATQIRSRTDVLIERIGLRSVLPELGLPRSRARVGSSALIARSVTPSAAAVRERTGAAASWSPRRWAARLRLTGDPDRAPVKEALDACRFHADMAAAAGAMAALYERGSDGRGQHVDVSVQEVAFCRNVNGVLVWQFDRRKLHRVGGALNYGQATVRCIWPLADGCCFHSLMTGRFGAPANQALSDWIDEAACDNPLRGVDWVAYNRSTLDADTRAAVGSARSSDFFRTRTRRRSIARAPARHQRHGRRRARRRAGRSASAGAQLLAVEDGVDKPARFVGVRAGERPAAPSRAPSHRVDRAGPLARRPRARLLLGAGRLDHDQDAGRSRRRRRQSRIAHPTVPVAHRRAGQRLARRTTSTTSRGSRISTARSAASRST